MTTRVKEDFLTSFSFGISSLSRVVLILFTVSVLGIMAAQQTKVGGMGEAKPATAEVQGFLDQVRAQAEEKANRTFTDFKAVEFATQLVNGLNYFIKADTGNGKFVFVRLHKPFREDKVTFSRILDDKEGQDKLQYF